MTKIKIIPHPQLQSSTRLSAVDLNKIHFANRRTKLTPELLRKMKSWG